MKKVWKSESGQEFDTALEAAKDEASFWKEKYDDLRREKPVENQPTVESGGHQ